jgi:hypothetical protein
MQQSLRSYLTAGIAIVGASPIAVTPVVPPSPTCSTAGSSSSTTTSSTRPSSPAPATVTGGDLSANLTNVLVELLQRLF